MDEIASLRQARKRAGLTLRDAAVLLECNHATIGDVEAGKITISPATRTCWINKYIGAQARNKQNKRKVA